MPLPDAIKRSPRVYTLLQNLDLENVTADTLADVADTISIEEQNEDELRRICLVAFARMVTKGSFDGWLSGGGIQYAFDPIDASLMPATYANFSPTDVYRLQSTTTASTAMEDKALFIRFVAPKDGALGDFTLRTGVTQSGKEDVQIGIYGSSGGLPSGAGIGFLDIDVNGGADLYTSSSWTTTPTLTGGDTYWIGFAPAGATVPAISTAAYGQFLSLGLTHYPGTGYNTLYNYSGTDFDIPSTVDLSVLQPKNLIAFPVWMYKYA